MAGDLANPEPDPVTADDTLLTALRRFGRRDADVLPVVETASHHRLVGLVSRQDLWNAYERVLTVEGEGHHPYGV
ncbi:MAG TPA: CBS domain-containing protein [Gemmatimonadales bacterium]|nr:CBS domain-containing protein [Gemmatimonadales bacterium]